MGVRGFFTALLRAYPQAATILHIDSIPQQTTANPHEAALSLFAEPVDYLYFDINNLLYEAARLAKDEAHFFAVLFKKVEKVMHHFVPKKTLYLAMDGPGMYKRLHANLVFVVNYGLCHLLLLTYTGPKAKLVTQRMRRLKTSYQQEREKELANMQAMTGEGVINAIASSTVIDSLQFTPGTDFMHKLKNALCYFSVRKLDQQTFKVWLCKLTRERICLLTSLFQDVQFIVSGSDRPDEGELKIFQHMNQTSSLDISQSEVRGNGEMKKIVVVGKYVRHMCSS
jgi:5'-3' exonuclease